MKPEPTDGSRPTMASERVLILGMARSGVAAARLCLADGADVVCLDLRRPEGADEDLTYLKAGGAEFHWGPHPLAALSGVTRIIKSPGVRGEIELLNEARGRGIPIWSELELGFRRARGAVVAITGTNGKSTTTAWAADLLARAAIPYELAGNIGRPLADAVMEAEPGAVLVTEVSSFQLEDTESFRPRCAALLNLTPDHIDRHGDLARYREAKMRMFARQSSADYAVLGEQEDLASEVAARFRPRVLRFLFEDRGHEGAFVRSGTIITRFEGVEREYVPVGELSLPGPHNVANAMAALCLLLPLGVPTEVAREGLRRFPGLEHRLERVAVSHGVTYVNDSKATNTDSLVTALRAFTSPLLLLAGGRDKGQDFSPLRELVRSRSKRVLLFGESEETIRRAWGEDLCDLCGDMATALKHARETAEQGDTVLLSPACASFDQFRDYEDRGRQFRRLVIELVQHEGGTSI